MSKSKKPFNPFYLLAMLFGIAFTITACAFGVMMLKSIRPEGLPEAGAPGHGLMDLLGRHGTAILTAELAGLAVFTLPAIYLDHLRGRREVARRERDASESFNPEPAATASAEYKTVAADSGLNDAMQKATPELGSKP